MAQSQVIQGLAARRQERAPGRDRGTPWDALEELARRGKLTLKEVEDIRTSARRTGATLEDVLEERGIASTEEITAATAYCEGVQRADLEAHPPDPRLIDTFGPSQCIRHACIPWRRLGRQTLIVSPTRAQFEAAQPALERAFGPCRFAVAPADDITRAVMRQRSGTLARRAETRLPRVESCRTLFTGNWEKFGFVLLFCAALALLAAPVGLYAVLLAWSIVTLLATSALKLSAAILAAKRLAKPRPPLDLSTMAQAHLPRISILVPLYQETSIAESLLERLRKLNYPRERLEVILITESEDLTTRDTLAAVDLPPWFRQITVPPGRVKTKPRALNYALDHCRGTIIGVYDAEDAPEPDQLLTVAAEFARAAPDVACLQGRLDYYNPHQNWLARCFTMEYAAWFRVVLPGLADMDLPVPLGGTTLFFRRSALEDLNGWDAHNVTEDADLGLRLTRRGYRTALVDAVTHEEANCRAWPWVRQRSRWLKGYAVTYAVHMRNPRQLWRDLGPKGFFGVQILFACTLSQFLLAPVLWSCWLMLFGFDHPILHLGSAALFWSIAGFFMVAEAIGFAVVALGVRQTKHKGVLRWMPLLPAYFTLGTAAAYKGLFELFARPFFWDKTAHGLPAKGSPAP